jgi:SAM-dependent methyltransferase
MMKNETGEISSPQVKHFVSPCCRSTLTEEDTKLTCGECGLVFEVIDGLYKFVVEDSQHGELSASEMRAVLNVARSKGWRYAIENLRNVNKKRISRLISDPRRQKSVELLSGVGGRVLDFGCGYGGVTTVLAQMFDEVVSLDGSEERVSLLNIIKQQENIQNITTICHMDVLNLPFPDDYFDAVVLVGVLEYLPLTISTFTTQEAHDKCLKSFLRILRPGGTILVHSKNRFGWQYLLGGKDQTGLRFGPALPTPLANIILRLMGRDTRRIINYSYNGYKKLFKHSGFNDIRLHAPYPGYQSPDYVFDLSTKLSPQVKQHMTDKVSFPKYVIFRLLAFLGLFHKVIPHFTVVAKKPNIGVQP